MKYLIYIIFLILSVMVMSSCMNKDSNVNKEIERESDLWPDEFDINAVYNDILSETSHIEIRNGMNGSSIFVDDSNTIEKLIEGMKLLTIMKRKNQEDSDGWMYTVRFFSSDHTRWFQIIIGSSKLSDNYRAGEKMESISPYYELKNLDTVLEVLDTLFAE